MSKSLKRALVLASVASMIDLFNRNNIKILQDLGYQVDVASNFNYGSITSQEKVNECKEELQSNEVHVYNIEYPRSPLKLIKIIKAYKATKQLVNNNYKLVHCHSPIGGILCRLAFRKSRRKGTKVIYTAHGFHFYKGAPIKNWIMYYPAEKFCSRFTDVLITINKEDYEFAKKHMKAKKVEYVPGVGVDFDKFKNCKVDVVKKRKELGIPKDAFLILSVGELSKRKNHRIVLDALHELNDPKVYYAIAGHGALHDYLLDYAKKLGLENTFKLLGYRSDTKELYKCADLYVHPSIHEGLPVSVMEALASGTLTITSNIRGCSDLLDSKYLFDNADNNSLYSIISKCIFIQNKEIHISKVFSVQNCNRIYKKLYLRS